MCNTCGLWCMRNILCVHLLILSIIMAIESSYASEEKPVVIILNGKPQAIIVLPDLKVPNKRDIREAAEDDAARILREHLMQISGTELVITREQDLGPIQVRDGQIVLSKESSVRSFILIGEGKLANTLGITAKDLGLGGMLVESRGNALVLMGHPEAVSFLDGGGIHAAVIALLEELGCRYLWPGETGKVVPKKTTITVGPVSKSFTPSFGQRHIRWYGYADRVTSGLAFLQLDQSDWQRSYDSAVASQADVSWRLWHGEGGDLGISGGHAFGWVWEEFGKDHPEWFALQADGSRDQSAVTGDRVRLCKSNPDVIKAIADHVIEEVRKKPNTRSVSLSPNDDGYSSFCMCDKCKVLDPIEAPKVNLPLYAKVGRPERTVVEYPALTDRMVFFWNSIAEQVTHFYPDLLFVIDAYSFYQTPPVQRRLHPNLVVRYVPNSADYIDGWKQRGASKFLWRPNILSTGTNSGTVSVYAKNLADTFRQMAEYGILATDFDSVFGYWALHGLNYCVAARLNWNPYLKYEDILEDYCSSGFGAGHTHIKNYFLAAETATCVAGQDGLTSDVITELRSLLRNATNATANDSPSQDRIRFLRIGLNFTELHTRINKMAEAASRRDPGVDMNLARRLLDLNFLVMRDLALKHHLAVNVAYLAWKTSSFSTWRSLGWDGKPSDELLERFANASRTLTGDEDSIEDMVSALGMSKYMTEPQNIRIIDR